MKAWHNVQHECTQQQMRGHRRGRTGSNTKPYRLRERQYRAARARTQPAALRQPRYVRCAGRRAGRMSSTASFTQKPRQEPRYVPNTSLSSDCVGNWRHPQSLSRVGEVNSHHARKAISDFFGIVGPCVKHHHKPSAQVMMLDVPPIQAHLVSTDALCQ